MKARHAFFLFVALVTAGILASCTPNGGSIFATIETEKKVVDSTLPKTLTVDDMATPGGGVYYLAAGSIFKGTLPGAALPITWIPTAADTTRPFNPPDMLCNTLALFSGRLWAGFFMIGSNVGLMESDVSYAFTSAGLVEDPVVKGKQVVLLQAVNGKLFAVTTPIAASNNVYELDYFNGTTWYPVKTNLGYPISGVAWDGSAYWAVGRKITSAVPPVTSEPVVYSGTSADPPVFSETSLGAITISATDDLRGVFADPVNNNRVFIATKLSGVYYRDGLAGAWTQSATKDVNSNMVGCLTVAGPVDTGKIMYLAGSDGYGYYTITAGSTQPAATRYGDNTIKLYTSAIRRIFIDGTTVFMGTAGNGLWRATFDPATGAPASGTAWVHE